MKGLKYLSQKELPSTLDMKTESVDELNIQYLN